MLFTSSRLPLILTIVAGIAMITVTAWQGVRFWQNETSAGDTTSTADMTMAETDTRKVPEVNLASFALFGEPGKEAPQTEPDTENLPETNLRLFLRGVLAASGDFPGSALIEDVLFAPIASSLNAAANSRTSIFPKMKTERGSPWLPRKPPMSRRNPVALKFVQLVWTDDLPPPTQTPATNAARKSGSAWNNFANA